MIPIKYVLLEGVDLSGKSSLYRSLHKATSFKYNIHDRSCLSMLCYARLYGRDEASHRARLMEEVCDANNYTVILMPPRKTILERFRSRGDDFQDEASLMRLYDIFDEEVKRIGDLANIVVVRSELDLPVLTENVRSWIELYESMTPTDLGHFTKFWAALPSSKEVQLRVSFDVPVKHSDTSVMNHPDEGDYYTGILRSCEDVIHAEISGRNPYNLPQGLDSRRFYYSSDSCISSVHFLLRDKRLKVVCTLRSTDAVKNGPIDLRFLAHLSAEVPRTFLWDVDSIQLDVRFNSLHIC